MIPSLYTPHLKNPINAAALASQGVKNPMTLLSRLQSESKEITLEDGTVLKPPGVDPSGGRRIVICGDTYDASGILPLVRSPESSTSTATSLPPSLARLFPPSSSSSPSSDYIDLLIHESTNAFLPSHDDSQSPLRPSPPSLESVTALARSHGHSTPQVAGSFARAARAKRVVLNHLSTKYPDPESQRLGRAEGDGEKEKEDETREKWRGMLREIERQAEEVLCEGMEGEKKGEGEWRVKTARDFMEVEVVRRDKLGGGNAAEGKAGKGKRAKQ